MIGTARTPVSSICRATAMPRKVIGRRMTCPKLAHGGAEHPQQLVRVMRDREHGRADVFQNAAALAAHQRLVAGDDRAHAFDQRGAGVVGAAPGDAAAVFDNAALGRGKQERAGRIERARPRSGR